MKPFTSISVFFLALIAFGHLLRVLTGWEIIINATVIPMWPSVLVFLVFGGLAIVALAGSQSRGLDGGRTPNQSPSICFRRVTRSCFLG